MCMDMISSKKAPETGVGWKVLVGKKSSKQHYKFKMTGFNEADTSHFLPLNYVLWRRYKSGFHIWATLSGAKEWKRCGGAIYKVRFKEGKKLGYQYNFPVIIANKVKILRKVTKKELSTVA